MTLPKKILIVEGNADLSKLLAMHLEDANYAVTRTADGEKVCQSVARRV